MQVSCPYSLSTIQTTNLLHYIYSRRFIPSLLPFLTDCYDFLPNVILCLLLHPLFTTLSSPSISHFNPSLGLFDPVHGGLLARVVDRFIDDTLIDLNKDIHQRTFTRIPAHLRSLAPGVPEFSFTSLNFGSSGSTAKPQPRHQPPSSRPSSSAAPSVFLSSSSHSRPAPASSSQASASIASVIDDNSAYHGSDTTQWHRPLLAANTLYSSMNDNITSLNALLHGPFNMFSSSLTGNSITAFHLAYRFANPSVYSQDYFERQKVCNLDFPP